MMWTYVDLYGKQTKRELKVNKKVQNTLPAKEA